ncbi:YbaB/EbfC family nucleoid-associated protein [Actinoallomurus sp. NPDC050550]|uniref:YbaB/EbfC family nucleoid-associated protein n=1 Tax=Actinoallomurus sp. NPDC050550 TaxID=3154937 RepID=UPI0033D04AFE
MKDDAGAWGQVRAELKEAISQCEQFEVAARRKRVVQTDRQGIVTVTANGFGDIVDLAISDQALRHPQRLGAQITEAVVRARRAGQIVGERLRELKFDAAPSANSLKTVISEIPDAVNYDQIDYSGAADTKNAIAECGEFLQRLSGDVGAFERRFLRCEIGAAVGHVESNVTESRLRISIRPEAPREVGLERLSQQTMTAINRVAKQSSGVRVGTIKKALVESPVRKFGRAIGEE